MATYKKTGTKIRTKKAQTSTIGEDSTTAEVFNTLDETASRSEQWVIKNQKAIFGVIALIVISILGLMAYQKYVAEPQEKEAANELAFPKVYFEQAISSAVAVDSLFNLGLNGAEGKYGFIDVADKFSGTKAGNLAHYYAGISFLKMKQYKDAITHLEQFSSDDALLGPTAKGAIGDAFADINQPEDAMDFYIQAANLQSNGFSTPLFLFKAGNTALELGKFDKALSLFNQIKNEYPTSEEGKNIEVFISKATYATK